MPRKSNKSKSSLVFRFAELISLIQQYNVFLLNTNNKFRLLCDADYLFLIRNIICDKNNSYDYDYYKFFVEKDIATIKDLIKNKQLVKVG